MKDLEIELRDLLMLGGQPIPTLQPGATYHAGLAMKFLYTQLLQYDEQGQTKGACSSSGALGTSGFVWHPVIWC